MWVAWAENLVYYTLNINDLNTESCKRFNMLSRRNICPKYSNLGTTLKY